MGSRVPTERKYKKMSQHSEEAEKRQNEIIRKMTPAQRLGIAQELYQTAWEIKKSGIKAMHPDWSEEKIGAHTRRIFVTGYAGA